MKIAVPSLAQRADYYDLERFAKQGFVLAAASAVGLERALILNKEDIATRARLLGYYSVLRPKNKTDKESAVSTRLRHILWFVEHAPDCKFAGNTYLAFDKKQCPAEYAKVKEAWLKQVHKSTKKSSAVINAAMFFFAQENDLSKKLLNGLAKKDPRNAWAKMLLAKLHNSSPESIVARFPPEVKTDFDYALWRERADSLHLDTAAMYNGTMPESCIENLEKVISIYPQDMTTRAELLGFYGKRCKRANVIGYDAEFLRRYLEHTLWFIRYIPGSHLVGNFRSLETIDKSLVPAEYNLLRREWLGLLKLRGNDAAILASAAAFFFSGKFYEHAKRLARKAKRLGKEDRGVSRILKYALYKSRRKFVDLKSAYFREILDKVASPCNYRSKKNIR